MDACLICARCVCWPLTSEVLTFTECWNDLRFASKKPDRIDVTGNFYWPTGDGGFGWQANPILGAEAKDRDTGELNIPAFDHSCRFGAFGSLLPEDFGPRMVVGRRGEGVADSSIRCGSELASKFG